MRSVITSWLEDVDRTIPGVVVFQLTNGLFWAGTEAEVEIAEYGWPRATLYHENGTFLLGFEGSDERVEVTLVACRREVWDQSLRREVPGAMLAGT
ncbi:MAG: hypothetical protein JWN86_1178 [Planctomycetota bacterium]|nr:hypothetical protein [Planctomycetota bacterium]